MNAYKSRVGNIEGFLERELSLEEKLEIAFETQSLHDFIELIELGADPKGVLALAKRMGGRLSMCQCDLLKAISNRQQIMFWR